MVPVGGGRRLRMRPRDPAVLAWMRLVRVFQRVHQVSSRGLRCSALSLAHFDVLMHVGADEGISQQELADSLLVTKGNVCQILSRMEEADLTRRESKGRMNRVFLTDWGREVFERVRPDHERRLAMCFSGLNDGEQRQLLALLRKLDRELGPWDQATSDV